MTRIFILLITLLWTHSALAEAVAYRLDRANSQVVYSVQFENKPLQGLFPVDSADIKLDFAGSGSRVNVVLNAAGATAGFPFAAEALKGKTVLNTAEHPKITFTSNGFKVPQGRANVGGNVTIRGVTRPITLSAQVYRQKGAAAGDLSKMTVHITGSISRAAFGADGFKDMVGDTVTINIVARIDQAG